MIKRYLSTLVRELNYFLNSTSIHGLPYIHQSQSIPTRVIWTVLVVGALTTATVFLVSTVKDWEINHISTTIKTENVDKFPFPAVTFHPGDFSSEKAFMRSFLNHFQLTRYRADSPLYNNEEFLKEYKYLLNFKNSKSLFYWVQKYLLTSGREFLKNKNRLIKNEVCSLVSLVVKNRSNKEKYTEVILDLFDVNIFKYRRYDKVLSFMKTVISPNITMMINEENITKSEVKSLCEAKENKEIKTELDALLLSYLSAFMDIKKTVVGPGDLATEEYFRDDFLHEKITKMFNEITGSSLPVSVVTIPLSFVKLTKNDEKSTLKGTWKIPDSNLSDFELERYQRTWLVFLGGDERLYFYCKEKECNSEREFHIAVTEKEKEIPRAMLSGGKNKHKVREFPLKSSPCETEELVSVLEFNSVCEFQRNYSRNIAGILKLLKYSKQSPTYIEKEIENEVFGSLDSMEILHGFYVDKSTRKTNNNAFIPLCKFEGEPEEMIFEKCDLFRRSFTNKGIGYTFNNINSGSLLKQGGTLNTQIKEFNLNQQLEPRLIKSASQEHSLTVIIENNIEEVENFEKSKKPNLPQGEISIKPNPIQLVLHDPNTPANVRSKSLSIPLGQTTTIYVTPTVTETDRSGQELSEEERSCRMKGENEGLSIFLAYSREACMFECQLSQAVRRCGCYPWEYPISTADTFLFCDNLGNICFERMMRNVSSTTSCTCPMDCNSISYSYSIVSNPISEEEQCPKKSEDSIFKEFRKKPSPPKFIRRAREFMFYNESSDEADICKRMLPYRAEVTIRLATDTVSVTVRSRRLSFFDKLSGFGGILGLFTGISILSMVEVAFWILRYILKKS